MSIKTAAELKAYFLTGAKPTQAQFEDLIDTLMAPTIADIAAASDEISSVVVGNGLTFRTPFAFKVTEVRANLKTAQTSGDIVTVNIKENGTTILSTKITIDNGEKTSKTAAIPAVISDSTLADDAEITVHIEQVGDGTAIGLKVAIIGYKIN